MYSGTVFHSRGTYFFCLSQVFFFQYYYSLFHPFTPFFFRFTFIAVPLRNEAEERKGRRLIYNQDSATWEAKLDPGQRIQMRLLTLVLRYVSGVSFFNFFMCNCTERGSGEVVTFMRKKMVF